MFNSGGQWPSHVKTLWQIDRRRNLFALAQLYLFTRISNSDLRSNGEQKAILISTSLDICDHFIVFNWYCAAIHMGFMFPFYIPSLQTSKMNLNMIGLFFMLMNSNYWDTSDLFPSSHQTQHCLILFYCTRQTLLTVQRMPTTCTVPWWV